MDIQRSDRPRSRRALHYSLGAAVLGLVTVLLASLKPAAPAVDRDSVWVDAVRRGEMVRDVGGPGSLIPEQMRWIAALTPARVDRILTQPGDSVDVATVLVELSNPDVQIQALEAQQQLTAAEAQLVNLRTTLENQRLAQNAIVTQMRTTFNEARRSAMVAETLAVKGLGSPFELQRARDLLQEAEARLGIEEDRLRLVIGSTPSQLKVQQDQVSRLRAIDAHRRNEVLGLRVRAGEAGVLQELPLQLGQWVVPGQVLAKVVQPRRLKAVLRIPETLAPEVRIGQRASIDMRNGITPGRVIRIDPAAQNGTVTVDVALEGPLPAGARPDLSVDGTIEIERLTDALHVGRPRYGQPHTAIGMFKLEPDGDHAVLVRVRLGRASVNAVEVIEGLAVGDSVILSDMSRWEAVQRVRIRR